MLGNSGSPCITPVSPHKGWAPGPIQGIVCLVQVQEDCVEDRLPRDRNLLKQFDLEGCGTRTSSRPEPMEGVVVGDGGGEAEIKDHHHLLPHHLHEIYATVVTAPFRD